MATPYDVLRWAVGKIYQAVGFEVLSATAATTTYTVLITDSRVIRTDTTAAAFNLTLPATPYNGMQYTIYDGAAAGSWNTNNLTVVGKSGGTGKQIVVSGAAAADSVALSARSGAITLRYDSTSTLWHSINKN